MRQIKLSTSDDYCLVDDEDYDELIKNKWRALWRKGQIKAAIRSTAYPQKTIYMHRQILKLIDSNTDVDHRDNNPLNNQRNNLRICTYHENNKNVSVRKTSKSGFKGVYFDKQMSKFRARLHVNKKCVQLGLFDLAIDAAKAYNNAAIKHHGEFAKLNVEV